jgi:hypothetical protein
MSLTVCIIRSALPFLLGCVWARETNLYAVCGGEGVEFDIIELTTVDTLYGCKSQIKL